MKRPARYWLGWRERVAEFPQQELPVEVLGAWCSGWAADDSYSTMVAWVEARSEEAARAVILKHWGEGKEWRFCTQTSADFDPGDRFPLSKKARQRAMGGKP